jgi:hypothetical protein
MAGLSELAAIALQGLDEGAVLNSTHRHARELIAEGLAYEDGHRLRITEAGRIWARRGVGYLGEDSVGYDPLPPIDRKPVSWWKSRGPEPGDDIYEAPAEPCTDTGFTVHSEAEVAAQIAAGPHMMKGLETLPVPRPLTVEEEGHVTDALRHSTKLAGSFALDRARAQRAAGATNGKLGVWISEEWVLAFLDAYETNEG